MPEPTNAGEPGPLPPSPTVQTLGNHPRRGRLARVGLVVAAVGCLAAAAVAGTVAERVVTRSATPAERAAATAAAVVDRSQSWPAGRIFPARLGYGTDLLTNETAARIAISAQDACATAVDPSFRKLTERDHCRAGLRATYLDQLQGIVYTIGVFAFPSTRDAVSFDAGLRSVDPQLIAVRALALPGTASERFADAARQAGTARQDGPFVVLTAAGYADGRSAAATGERRASIFQPAAQLAAEVLGPLAAPAPVNCHSAEWSC